MGVILIIYLLGWSSWSQFSCNPGRNHLQPIQNPEKAHGWKNKNWWCELWKCFFSFSKVAFSSSSARKLHQPSQTAPLRKLVLQNIHEAKIMVVWAGDMVMPWSSWTWLAWKIYNMLVFASLWFPTSKNHLKFGVTEISWDIHVGDIQWDIHVGKPPIRAL